MLTSYMIDELTKVFQENVRRGIRKLDTHFGHPLWRGEIDYSILDLYSIDDCILGQLFGRYGTGILTLGVRDGDLFGFHCDEISDEYAENSADNRAIYKLLTNVWEEEADTYKYEGMPVWNDIHGRYLPKLADGEYRFN